MERLEAVRAIRTETKTNFLIEVDGGISNNASTPPASGADILVAGTAVFHTGLRRLDRSPPPRHPHRPTTRIAAKRRHSAENPRARPRIVAPA
jgi:hypothetical protein